MDSPFCASRSQLRQEIITCWQMIEQLKRAIDRQKESLQDHIDTNIQLHARVRELEDELYALRNKP